MKLRNRPPIIETDIVVTFDDRRYQVRGLEKNNSLGRLKVNLFVSRDELLHVDTFDLYLARARNSFIKQASSEIYIEEDAIRRFIARRGGWGSTLVDPGSAVAIRYGVYGAPETFIIDTEGIVRQKVTGAMTTGHLDRLLSEAS